MPARYLTVPCCVLITLLFGPLTLAQTTSQDTDQYGPVVYSVYALQDDVPEPPPRPIPELPEMVIRGAPQPFPSQPLAADTVVAPTRTETPISQVGSSVTVVNEDQIRASGKARVAEVLREVVGADVVQQGSAGGLTSVFLRGTNSQHTKVMLDGISINDPSNATRGFDFSTLDVENIERIEVLRGPQSLLYGSDAIGGVINIVTKRGAGPLSIRSTTRGGTFGTWRQTGQLSGGTERYYYALGGAYSKTDGVSQAARRLGNTERDGYSNGTLSGRFGWTPSESLNVDYVFRWSDADAEVDDFDFFTGLPTDNLIRHNLARQFYNRIQLQSIALDGALEQTVGFNLSHYSRDDTDTGSPFVPPTFRGETRAVTYQADLLLLDNNTLSAGASYLQEDAESSFVSQVSQNNSSAFVMDQFQVLERWFVTVGSRWDDWNTAGTASTYRMTNLIKVPETGGAFHGSIGTGFRAPALAENLFQYGNPNLRPERSKGWDIGVRQSLFDDRASVDCTYFRNDLTDLILFDFGTFSLQNVGAARTTGIELTAQWRVSSTTRLWANYTYLDATNLDTDAQLVRRPRNKVSLGLTRPLWRNRGTLNLDMVYTGPRLDTRNVVLGDYTLVNLSARYPVRDHWNVFVRGANLLDQKYEQVNGYGTQGIAAYGGLDFVW